MRHLYYWLRKISLIFFSCFYYYFKHHPLAKLLLVCTTHGSLKMNISINFEREFKFYIFYFITFIFQLFCFYDYVAVKSSCLAVKSFCQVSLGTIQGNHNSKISSTCKHNIKALRQISKEYLENIWRQIFLDFFTENKKCLGSHLIRKAFAHQAMMLFGSIRDIHQTNYEAQLQYPDSNFWTLLNFRQLQIHGKNQVIEDNLKLILEISHMSSLSGSIFT